jgi:predicted nucleic acid-binding protein
MKDKRAFFDSSALVPFLIHQDASARMRQLLRQHPKPMVCWLTVVEINSALARLVRQGLLQAAGRNLALRQLSILEAKWDEVLPTSAVREQATDLLHKYELRTGDALQLASAVVWSNGQPRSKRFVTLDERLAKAAEGAGFQVLK